MISRRGFLGWPWRCLPCGAVFSLFLTGFASAQARPEPPPEDQLAAPGRAGWSVDERSGCWLWNGKPRPGEAVVWTGGCDADGRAIGHGVREWNTDGKTTSRYEGEL